MAHGPCHDAIPFGPCRARSRNHFTYKLHTEYSLIFVQYISAFQAGFCIYRPAECMTFGVGKGGLKTAPDIPFCISLEVNMSRTKASFLRGALSDCTVLYCMFIQTYRVCNASVPAGDIIR